MARRRMPKVLGLKQANACLSGRDFGSAAATEPAGLANFFQLL